MQHGDTLWTWQGKFNKPIVKVDDGVSLIACSDEEELFYMKVFTDDWDEKAQVIMQLNIHFASHKLTETFKDLDRNV